MTTVQIVFIIIACIVFMIMCFFKLPSFIKFMWEIGEMVLFFIEDKVKEGLDGWKDVFEGLKK